MLDSSQVTYKFPLLHYWPLEVPKGRMGSSIPQQISTRLEEAASFPHLEKVHTEVQSCNLSTWSWIRGLPGSEVSPGSSRPELQDETLSQKIKSIIIIWHIQNYTGPHHSNIATMQTNELSCPGPFKSSLILPYPMSSPWVSPEVFWADCKPRGRLTTPPHLDHCSCAVTVTTVSRASECCSTTGRPGCPLLTPPNSTPGSLTAVQTLQAQCSASDMWLASPSKIY